MKKIIITKDYLELAVELDAFTEGVEVSSWISIFSKSDSILIWFFIAKLVTTHIIEQ